MPSTSLSLPLSSVSRPAGLDSGAIGFAAANSVGPGDADANEDAEDAAQHLVEDNEGDVRRQKAPRTVDKGVLKAAREAVEVAWERHDVYELAAHIGYRNRQAL